ncbi:MAG: beta-galactosidase GalB [Acidobacteriota bacterium]
MFCFPFRLLTSWLIAGAWLAAPAAQEAAEAAPPALRERISLNSDWRFFKYASPDQADGFAYDLRPAYRLPRRGLEGTEPKSPVVLLKPWILPASNAFRSGPRFERPPGDPGADFPFVQADFDDSGWQHVDLPHDWAAAGPFFAGPDPEVGGGMGRLPSPGVAWYRKKFVIPASDTGRRIFLEVEGAMAYAAVWLNGRLVGGWPYGYNSFQLDLTPYVRWGEENQLAVRLENPPESSRWYPGGGLYRNVWLVKTQPVHVAQWGTFVTTPEVSLEEATVSLEVTVANEAPAETAVEIRSEIFELDAAGRLTGAPVAEFPAQQIRVPAGGRATSSAAAKVSRPRLWGPPPTQTPHLYAVVTTLVVAGEVTDRYETPFGIRTVRFDPDRGLLINGEHIEIKGVNLHHDLGPLGAAFNRRAAERQLELLREMGANAVRTAHNPPAPEFLELTDRMGFLVVDEIFDVWEIKKTPLDFHLIFPDWHEADLRAFIRRDRNHPSVILWSFGNEIGEQGSGEEGARLARRLAAIAKEEDPTRPVTVAMNFAKPDMPLPETVDVICLNYQGEGIRNAPAYRGLPGITTEPLYAAFHERFPEKAVLSCENAATVSTRGTYLFPVYEADSAPVKNGQGGDPERAYVSAYELYTAPFGASPDRVFAAQDRHPFVAGGFVWSGWDYLGEPTPYYSARSSYFGIIDLAGFKKDRFYLYQARWRPDLPMAHILPHWTWPERIGEITPVHVFTSGDEAELFLNGHSLGRKKKGPFQYRLRWDDVRYEPGELKAVAYKNGKPWAEAVVVTAGPPARLEASVDRSEILADGRDLAFVTVRVTDAEGHVAPRAANRVRFVVEGPGELVATANGDPTCFVPFPSPERPAFNGLVLGIVRALPGRPGEIRVTVTSPNLQPAAVTIQAR